MTEPVNQRRVAALAPYAFAAAMVFLLYGVYGNAEQSTVLGRSAIRWMVRRWSGAAGDLSHAWLIPLVSGWLVWRARKLLAAAPKRTSGIGLALVGLSLVLHWIGVRSQQTRVSLFSLFLLFWSIPFALHGPAVARILAFPCAYLLFCIPGSFLDELSLPLRLMACAISVFSLNGAGIPSIRSGTAIYAGDPRHPLALDVADACSGLRSLLAMLALASVYAYLTQKTPLKKLLLFCASVPIAIIANVFRIVAIAMVGHWFGHERAMTVYHDYSGFLVFGMAVVLMAAAGDVIGRIGGRRKDPSVTPWRP